MRAEEIINREIELFLEEYARQVYIVIIYADIDSRIDKLNYNLITYSEVIESIYKRNGKTYINLNESFIDERNRNQSELIKYERMEEERDYWMSRL